jgi:hypothetical protein
MDIQLDQMDSRNSRKVAESGANKKLRSFMGKVHETNGLYGDKNKNSKKNGGEKDTFSTNKHGLTFMNSKEGEKYLTGGDYSAGGKTFSGENTSAVNKGLKPYVTIIEATDNFAAGDKISIKDIIENK